MNAVARYLAWWRATPIYRRYDAFVSNPVVWRRLNGWLFVGWVVIGPYIVSSPTLRKSVPVLVFISVYANMGGHLSAWGSNRVEVMQVRMAAEKEAEDLPAEVVQAIKADPEIPTHDQPR